VDGYLIVIIGYIDIKAIGRLKKSLPKKRGESIACPSTIRWGAPKKSEE